MSGDRFATARELGLMEGFPPPPGKRVDRSNALMTPPFNRWSYQNMRTIYPSAPVVTAPSPSRLEIAIDANVTDLSVPHPGGRLVDFDTFLLETYTDALVVVAGDRIVHESYLNGMRPLQPHQMMSVTKSFAGLFGLIAAADGLLSEDDLVTATVPELDASSAFAEATFGQVLDMTNSLDFSEDYADPESGIVRYGRTLGWVPAPPGESAEGSLYDFLVTLPKDPSSEHGTMFHYQTPKTDVVNWVTSRATNASFQDNMASALWSKLGTEGETYVLLDRNGNLVAGGGLNACPHDLARFAVMMLNSGTYQNQRVVGPAVIDQIAAGASTHAFAAGPDAVEPMHQGDWSYRAQWWVRHTPQREAFTAIGIHGQWIYIDRHHGVAVIKQSSQPVSSDSYFDTYTLNAFDTIIDHITRN